MHYPTSGNFTSYDEVFSWIITFTPSGSYLCKTCPKMLTLLKHFIQRLIATYCNVRTLMNFTVPDDDENTRTFQSTDFWLVQLNRIYEAQSNEYGESIPLSHVHIVMMGQSLSIAGVCREFSLVYC